MLRGSIFAMYKLSNYWTYELKCILPHIFFENRRKCCPYQCCTDSAFTGLYFATQSILPVLLLLVDFVLRGSGNARFSPLAIVSKQVQKIFVIAPKTVNAGPKLFAARIGIVFSSAVVILHLIGLPFSAFTVAGVFAFCAFLEAAFSFCVACRIYPFVYKLNLRFSGQ